MIPTNVVSFMKKMVTTHDYTQDNSSDTFQSCGDQTSVNPLNKLRQTIASGVKARLPQTRSTPEMVVNTSYNISHQPSNDIEYGSNRGYQDHSYQQYSCSSQSPSASFPPRVMSMNAGSPGETVAERMSKPLQIVPHNRHAPQPTPSMSTTKPTATTTPTTSVGRPKGGHSCRVCVKNIGVDEFHLVCSECKQKVCDDCASYSSQDQQGYDQGNYWKCSVCRRKQGRAVDVNRKPPGRKASSWAVAESIATEGPGPDAQTIGLGGQSARIQLSINDPHFLSSSLKEQAEKVASNSIAASLAKTLTLGQDQVWRSMVEPDANSNNPQKTSLKATNSQDDGFWDKNNPADTSGSSSKSHDPSKDQDSKRPHHRRREENHQSMRSRRPGDKSQGDNGQLSQGRPELLTHQSEPQMATRGPLRPLQAVRSESDMGDPYAKGRFLEIQQDNCTSSNQQEDQPGNLQRRRSSVTKIQRQMRYEFDGPIDLMPPPAVAQRDQVRRTISSNDPQPVKNSSQQRQGRSASSDAADSSKLTTMSSLLDIKSAPPVISQNGSTFSRRSSYRASKGTQPFDFEPALIAKQESLDSKRLSNAAGSFDMTNLNSMHWGNVDQRRANDQPTGDPARQLFPGALDDSYSGGKAGGSSSLLLAPTSDTRRRRSFQMGETGTAAKSLPPRALPTPPRTPYTKQSSGPPDSFPTRSRSSGENSVAGSLLESSGGSSDADPIKIVIHDVDEAKPSDNEATKIRKRAILQRDSSKPTDDHRHFGLRVVGGQGDFNTRLYATVVKVVPGGIADIAGIRPGDKVLEWNGTRLTDRSFEEVQAILDDTTGNTIEVVVEQSSQQGPNQSSRRPASLQRFWSTAGPERNTLATLTRSSSDYFEPESERSPPMSPCRRRLPKTPEELTVMSGAGKIQLQLWYREGKNELVLTIISAHDLPHRTPSGPGHRAPPEPYVVVSMQSERTVNLMGSSGNIRTVSTPAAEASTRPMWNSTFVLEDLGPEEIRRTALCVSVWDYSGDQSGASDTLIGDALINLSRESMDDHPMWYRLRASQRRRSFQTGDSGGGNHPTQEPGGGSFLHPDYQQQVLGPLSAPDGTHFVASTPCTRRNSGQSDIPFIQRKFSNSSPQSRRNSSTNDDKDFVAVHERRASFRGMAPGMLGMNPAPQMK